MPNLKYIVQSDYHPSFRTKKIEGMFDFAPDKKNKIEWDVDIPIEEREWSVGLIIGASGSGKTTLAKNLFKESLVGDFEYDREKSFIDSFQSGIDVESIVRTLTSVGFSSVPSWFVPYYCLSTGQKFRVDLTRAVLERDFIVFDEYTSVVDRVVAMSTSVALSKLIRKSDKKFVAVTCHYDVEEFLQPDWVFDVSNNQFKWGCLRRPELKVDIRKAHTEEWSLFRKHHYLNSDINNSSQCFVAEVNSRPVAFSSYIHFPHPSSSKIKKEHRTVVLPDFQGLGIGVRLSDFVAQLCAEKGFVFTSVTSHPAMIAYRIKSPLWKLKRKGRMIGGGNVKKGMNNSKYRNTCSFEFVGG